MRVAPLGRPRSKNHKAKDIYIPRYSGPGKSGICVCGHSWKEHHLGMVGNQEYFEATNESYVPQECEHYGFNEFGGLDAKGKYHCYGYRDREIKHKKKKQHP